MDEIMKQNEIETALGAGMQLGSVRLVHDSPFVVLPESTRVEELEHMLPEPTRKRGMFVLHELESFVALIDEEKTAETRIYFDSSVNTFCAVFNDHGELPGWRDYRALYACPTSAEWKAWTGKDGRQMGQVDFAQFIESNLPDLANPPAADMLEISRSLEAKKKVNFASGIRLSNGQNELTYEEEISGTAAKGKLQVPEIFTVGIPVLEGGERYAVEARLRYRIAEGGRLTIWYELVRPHKVLEDAMLGVRTAIGEKTGIKVLAGAV